MSIRLAILRCLPGYHLSGVSSTPWSLSFRPSPYMVASDLDVQMAFDGQFSPPNHHPCGTCRYPTKNTSRSSVQVAILLSPHSYLEDFGLAFLSCTVRSSQEVSCTDPTLPEANNGYDCPQRQTSAAIGLVTSASYSDFPLLQFIRPLWPKFVLHVLHKLHKRCTERCRARPLPRRKFKNQECV